MRLLCSCARWVVALVMAAAAAEPVLANPYWHAVGRCLRGQPSTELRSYASDGPFLCKSGSSVEVLLVVNGSLEADVAGSSYDFWVNRYFQTGDREKKISSDTLLEKMKKLAEFASAQSTDRRVALVEARAPEVFVVCAGSAPAFCLPHYGSARTIGKIEVVERILRAREVRVQWVEKLSDLIGTPAASPIYAVGSEGFVTHSGRLYSRDATGAWSDRAVTLSGRCDFPGKLAALQARADIPKSPPQLDRRDAAMLAVSAPATWRGREEWLVDPELWCEGVKGP